MRDGGGRGGPGEAVELSVEIAARPATVWRCVTESGLLSRWLAAATTIDVRVGGAVRIDFARYATVVEGVVEEVRPNEALVFSWGVSAGAQTATLPVGSTRVRILLAPTASGTRVTLRHEGLPTEKDRADHRLGWSGYLGSLAGVAPLTAIDGTPETLWDTWFGAWAETDGARRAKAVARCAADDVSYADVHADLRGREALSSWMATCQAFFPGVKVVREGPVVASRAALLVRWKCEAADGKLFGRGTSVARVSLDGRLTAVQAFWE